LSRRELEVLRVLATGTSKRQAAARLYVSFNTVHTQVRSIYRKLDVHNLAAAVGRGRDPRPDRLMLCCRFSRTAC
jgi:LuxR family maltose regulon positive regulatory protein